MRIARARGLVIFSPHTPADPPPPPFPPAHTHTGSVPAVCQVLHEWLPFSPVYRWYDVRLTPIPTPLARVCLKTHAPFNPPEVARGYCQN
jgi:hypothetical protein